jgi:hypothetical protein
MSGPEFVIQGETEPANAIPLFDILVYSAKKHT